MHTSLDQPASGESFRLQAHADKMLEHAFDVLRAATVLGRLIWTSTAQ
jgi:hypothetical protein